MPDYRHCSLTRFETAAACFASAFAAAAAGRLFYRSWFAGLLFLPVCVMVPQYLGRCKGERMRRRLVTQFKDAALSVSAAVTAGYSVENAFRTAEKEMRTLYGTDGVITGEFALICRRLELNKTAEEAVWDLAVRSGSGEIRQFAEVFSASKRSGGSVAPILKQTADNISGRIAVREEIRTLMAAKRLEERIMCLMPALVLVYINLGDPGFTAPLYETIAGRLIMTACLLMYGTAVMIGEKIMNTEV